MAADLNREKDSSMTEPILELDDETYRRIVAHTDRANELCDGGSYEPALQEFLFALALVPPPVTEWEAAAYALAGIGDCLFHLGRYADALAPLKQAMLCPGAERNPFFPMRLGQVHYELGAFGPAKDELTRAWILGGPAVFAQEHRKYLAFLQS
jgi:tetratricopeptide (TPR) repeat protein